jgi:Spy/CpxP family protein refolding chaperone
MYTTMRWWRLAGCEPSYAGACGTSPHGHGRGYGMRMEMRGHGHGHGRMGARRPLRFLAWKLELEEEQLGEVAKILAELKTERAQGEVDHEKSLAALADAVSEESFDATRAGEGAAFRVASAERMRAATVKALERLHRLLTPEQRRTLAYLIRTGSFSL